jgi:cytochrome c551
MEWLVVVLAFILLGIGVVALAFSGGGRRRRKPTSSGRRAAAFGLGVVCLIGAVVLPAFVLVFNKDDQAQANAGVTLSDAQEHGRAVFARNCSQCHTLRAANAVGKVGPNLDQLHPPKPLVLNAIQQGRARGQGQMPANLIDGQDAQEVSDFVAKVAGR